MAPRSTAWRASATTSLPPLHGVLFGWDDASGCALAAGWCCHLWDEGGVSTRERVESSLLERLNGAGIDVERVRMLTPCSAKRCGRPVFAVGIEIDTEPVAVSGRASAPMVREQASPETHVTAASRREPRSRLRPSACSADPAKGHISSAILL